MKSFSLEDRSRNIQKMQSEEFDLVIVGGGINGAGIARDASMRGMRVALIEANDFASGTSSRSSKLIHGGIRYLENFEFQLVFEALSERQKLFAMAPHLVHPLRFMIPLYRNGRVGMGRMGLGMWAYDALSLFQAPELHERLTPVETCIRMPQILEKDLLGSFIYSDAYMDDDRLVIETLRSATQFETISASYVSMINPLYNLRNVVSAVRCFDKINKKNFTIRGRHFVSTVGAWSDKVGPKFSNHWRKILRPTKGIHLTFEKKRLPLSSAVVMAAEERIIFGIPRHEMVIVGTTDTDFLGDPESVVTDASDVQYLLDVLAHYFPGAKITADDIVASYAGVRPLVNDGSESEGKTSREHSIFTTDEKVTFVAGGKYTTYRLIAEHAVAEVLKHFSIEDRVRWAHAETESPLNRLVTADHNTIREILLESLTDITKWSRLPAERFIDRHSCEALEIVRKFGPQQPLQLEALHAIENTMCFHLVDFFARRVPLILAEPDHGFRFLNQVSEAFQRSLNWSNQEREFEEKQLRDYIQRELNWASALGVAKKIL